MNKYNRPDEFPTLFGFVEMGGILVAFTGYMFLVAAAVLIGIVLSPVLIPYYLWRGRK